MCQNKPIIIWGGAFLLAILYFYGLDLLIMSVQGLPLNFDLTPAR